MSTVFYRWGAGKDESRVTFDGTHISVFDFKREVILNNRMGNGKDFDLGVFDNVTGEGMSFNAVINPCWWKGQRLTGCRERQGGLCCRKRERHRT